jgi:hypothetical protein
VLLTQGMLAAARRQDQQAESLFRAVQNDPASPTTTRLALEMSWPGLFERQGKTRAAERMYKATLTPSSQRGRNSSTKTRGCPSPPTPRASTTTTSTCWCSKAGAMRLWLRPIRAAPGRWRKAWAWQGQASFHPAALNPARSPKRPAQRCSSTGWATSSPTSGPSRRQRSRSFRFPRRRDCGPRRALPQGSAGLGRPVETGNEDGQALYKLLVAPAAKLIRPNARS